MDEHYTQLRIRRSTLQKMWIASALTGEKLIDMIERWAAEELEKQGYEYRQNLQVQAVQTEKE